MAYEKQEWKCGDTVTADKLNHMEDGIANCGGALIVTYSEEEEPCPNGGTRTKHACSHSWQEIYNALVNDIPAYYKVTEAQGGTMGAALDPIFLAFANDTNMYKVEFVVSFQGKGSLDFPNATDKVWYDGECGK